MSLTKEDFVKFYKIYFNDVAAGATEYAIIDLDNDLDLQRDEGIVIKAQHLVPGDDTPWTDPEATAEVQIVDEQVGALYTFQYPKLVLEGRSTAATIEGSANKADRIYHGPMLFAKNIIVAGVNYDTTTAHDLEYCIEYQVVNLKKLKLDDIYMLLRGQDYEVS